MSLEVSVTDAPERHRYEAVTAGRELAGIAQYILDGSTITFTHTEVDPVFEGQGVAAQLVQVALRDARSRGLRIVPVCPYVKKWMAEHPTWADGL